MNSMNVVDRVADRLKANNVGEFFTDEDLYDLVKEAIPKIFFSPVVEKDSWGSSKSTKPSPIEQMMREVLYSMLQEQVKRWVDENASQILEMWKPILEKGVVEYTQKIVNEQATNQVKNVLNAWIDQINRNNPSGSMLARLF